MVHKNGRLRACEQLRTTARGASALVGAELPVAILLVAHGGVRGNAGAIVHDIVLYTPPVLTVAKGLLLGSEPWQYSNTVNTAIQQYSKSTPKLLY